MIIFPSFCSTIKCACSFFHTDYSQGGQSYSDPIVQVRIVCTVCNSIVVRLKVLGLCSYIGNPSYINILS